MTVSCIAPNLPINFLFKRCICLFLAVLGLHCCEQTPSICSEWGLLSRCDAQLLIAVASRVVEHMLVSCPQHVGSSQTRDQTDVPRMARGILKVVFPGPPGRPSPSNPLIPVLSQIRPSP